MGHELDVGRVGSAEIEEAEFASGVERANKLLEGRADASLRWDDHWRGRGDLGHHLLRRALGAQSGFGFIRTLHGAK